MSIDLLGSRNQDHVIEDVLKVLQKLIGWDWGQYGDVVFFVQGAFQNEEGELKLFEWVIGDKFEKHHV
jgi:hypothetical protein